MYGYPGMRSGVLAGRAFLDVGRVRFVLRLHRWCGERRADALFDGQGGVLQEVQ